MTETPQAVPCVNCGRPTANRYSWDMDAATIPACSPTCIFIAMYIAGKKSKRKPA